MDFEFVLQWDESPGKLVRRINMLASDRDVDPGAEGGMWQTDSR